MWSEADKALRFSLIFSSVLSLRLDPSVGFDSSFYILKNTAAN